MTQVRIITIDELTRALEQRAVAELWNVLTDDYFTGEMIPGSRRVPLDTIGRELSGAGLARDTAIVVYCSGPSCPQSKAAAAKLTTLGYTNVRAFEGGLQAWRRGAPSSSSPALARPEGERHPGEVTRQPKTREAPISPRQGWRTRSENGETGRGGSAMFPACLT
ncbi:MAG TPA: rhodanese-like domain-containing protein [Gemmatimonadaceae bacterium]|nr:rhodanese-like domain-containing protein [Gemmatimonadaceae bacterium]